jgi:acetyl-CoA synthetase
MIAVGGKDCVFCAVVLPGDPAAEEKPAEAIEPVAKTRPLIYEEFIDTVEDAHGALQSITFKIRRASTLLRRCGCALAAQKPEKLAMLHVDRNKTDTPLHLWGYQQGIKPRSQLLPVPGH